MRVFICKKQSNQNKNELNILFEDIDPHIIVITESWVNKDISDTELGLTGYEIFMKNRVGRRGGGVISYINQYIQAYEIKLEREANCDEAVWCNIVTGNSTITMGLVYRSPNKKEDNRTTIQNKYIYIYIYIHSYIQTTYIHAYVHTYTHKCIHRNNIHTYIYIYIYI